MRLSPIISLGGIFITKTKFCNKNTSQEENYLAAHHDGGVMSRQILFPTPFLLIFDSCLTNTSIFFLFREN